jgi:hypothetical protein
MLKVEAANVSGIWIINYQLTRHFIAENVNILASTPQSNFKIPLPSGSYESACNWEEVINKTREINQEI